MLCCPSEVGSGYVKPVLHFRELSGERGLEGHPAGPSREARLRPVVERHQLERASQRSSNNLQKRSEAVGRQDSCPFLSVLQPRPSRGARPDRGEEGGAPGLSWGVSY